EDEWTGRVVRLSSHAVDDADVLGERIESGCTVRILRRYEGDDDTHVLVPRRQLRVIDGVEANDVAGFDLHLPTQRCTGHGHREVPRRRSTAGTGRIGVVPVHRVRIEDRFLDAVTDEADLVSDATG